MNNYHKINTLNVKNNNLIDKNILNFLNDDKKLNYIGNIDLFLNNNLKICIIGPRKCSPYGEKVVKYLLDNLKFYNIVTISGLAYGIDGLVHEYSIYNHIKTIAIPGSGLSDEVLHPRAHIDLAYSIIENQGLLINSFDEHTRAAVWTFPYRNKLMAAMSDIIIVIEAEENSGTLITANDALNMGKTIMSIPQDIFNKTSLGSNNLLSEGAEVFVNIDKFIEKLKYISNQKNINLIPF